MAVMWELYNSVQKILPLFRLAVIPGVNIDENLNPSGLIKLNPSDFLVMRCIAKHENGVILKMIEDGKVRAVEVGPVTLGIAGNVIDGKITQYSSDGQNAWTWISEETIAHECGVCRHTVMRSLASLKKQGFVDFVSRGRNRYGQPQAPYKRINRVKLAAMLEYLPIFEKEWEDGKAADDAPASTDEDQACLDDRRGEQAA